MRNIVNSFPGKSNFQLALLASIGWLSLPLSNESYAGNAVESSSRRTPIVIAIEEAEPSVVSIQGRKSMRGESATSGEAFKQVNGMGTGIILDERGYILTNYHVVEGVSNIQVTLSTQKSHTAKLISHDPKTDLAVIKIEPSEPLTRIKLGTSSDLMTGEPVIALGNPFGYSHTASRGIISRLHRSVQVSDTQKYADLIQTDASINPGNSGGPLLNIDGQTIGINVAVRIGAQGIGFAIPIDEAIEVAARLMSAERLKGVSHGVVGQTAASANSIRMVVNKITPGSAADRAGLRAGDIITRVDDVGISRSLDFELAMLDRKNKEPAEIFYEREGQEVSVRLALAETKSPKSALTQRIWDEVGLKLSTVPEGEFAKFKTKFRGGMRVTAVRPESPAAEKLIKVGDILVGLHVWQTIKDEDLAFVLDQENLREDPIKFYVLQDQEAKYGYLTLVSGRR